MSSDGILDSSPVASAPAEDLPEHAVRVALLDLLKDAETITATEAAKALGYSSGLCSFHLRSLARHGYVEEAPHEGGRARPWRLRGRAGSPRPASADAASRAAEDSAAEDRPDGDFGELARGLEDESHRRWLAHRAAAPPDWQRDEAFSSVVYLTPEELAELGDAVRQLLARYRGRDTRAEMRPEEAVPVAAVMRLFPLIADAEVEVGAAHGGAPDIGGPGT
ncbi:DNA-binding transcriptional ArsR family regulator [Actinoalloteichus hoggarensis]|uniref:Helix-turn-helix domain protein n=1 Tax=Actinoalloteichus hoggarensis TaxID=1470176 RepID=A0A221W3C7_9PSEU|nr:winged helix-turn-helix domain-containing protein [Actinoalloteichus hoggarensis]ASO20308.1 Helix-turn-helix domain protein [Actinoalloteichus hoggarensis]MBB5918978.1 DNA-binding transcriptional ArsR family regulator [Actinoalloteichus hoggarensis]